jgi:hypothetical protein
MRAYSFACANIREYSFACANIRDYENLHKFYSDFKISIIFLYSKSAEHFPANSKSAENFPANVARLAFGHFFMEFDFVLNF